jgi:hypothetical protein
MTNTETNDKAATVAEQGANTAPAKAASKKGASQKKGAPKSRHLTWLLASNGKGDRRNFCRLQHSVMCQILRIDHYRAFLHLSCYRFS